MLPDVSQSCDMQGVPADFLTRNEQYVSASSEHRPKQVWLWPETDLETQRLVCLAQLPEDSSCGPF